MKRAARILGVLAVGSVLSIAQPTTASAAWTATTDSGSAARSATTTMPGGNQPTAMVSPPAGSTVAVTWAASSGGAPVAGYEVRSYDASTGAPRPVGPACAGIVAGTSCSETNVPIGSWRYSVIPRQQAWAGGESPLSDPVVVGADTTPPAVSSSVISKTVPYLPGYVRQGGAYYVYANVTDTSGVLSVTANATSLTTGGSAVVMTPGSFSVGGVAYNYRSVAIAVNLIHPEGTFTYSITAMDTALNSGTTSGWAVVVDNTSPSGTDVQAANTIPGIVGRMEAGDVLTYTFSEVIDPESILTGWTGSAANVVVRLTNNGANDRVTVYNSANMTLLSLGTIDTFSDFSTLSLTYGASGTPSTIIQSGSQIIITLGTMAGGTLNDTTARVMDWFPSASATDRAGNASTTTTVPESGLTDTDF